MDVENVITLGVLFLYLVFMLWIGYRTSKKITGLNDYILAGRSLPWYVLTMTFLATVANTAQVMGQPAFAYDSGYSYVFWMFLGTITIGTILLPRISVRLRGLDISTIGDFAKARFKGSNRVELLVSIWQVIWGIFVTALSLFGASLLIEVVTGMSWVLTIGIIAVVTIIYTIAGGLRAVVITDSVQWLIIILGTAVFVPLLFWKAGFFTTFFTKYLGETGMDVTEKGKELALTPGFTDIFTLAPGFDYVPALISFILISSLWIPIDLGFIQRMLAAKSIKEGSKGVHAYLIMFILVMTLIIMLGLYGKALIPNLENTDKIVVILAQETLPLIGSALFITAIAAAAMSTISTYLNAGSTVIVKNILLKFKPNLSINKQLMYTKFFTAFVCLAAIGFAPFVSANGIVKAATAFQVILVTSLTPVVLLGVFWKRFTERAAFYGCLITSLFTLTLLLISGDPGNVATSTGFFGVPIIFWGILVGVILFGGLSMLEQYNPENMSEQLQNIFSGETKLYKSTTDLKVVSAVWVVLIIIGISSSFGVKTAFPPISGKLSFLTDGYFLVVSAFVLIASIYMTYKVVRYIKNEIE